MNIVLIGNGFDLAHELPTTYTDFLTFLKRINIPPVKPADFNERLEQLVTDPANLDVIKQMQELFSHNVWHGYFREKLIANENWCDFETEIAYAVEQLESVKKILEKYRQVSLSFIKKQPDLVDITFLKAAIISYCHYTSYNRDPIIFDSNNNLQYKYNLYYISLKLSKAIQSFNFEQEIVLNGNDNTVTIPFEDLIEFILNELQAFTKCLELYLSKFVNKLSCPKIVFINDLLDKKDNNLLTFNYTSTPSNYNFPIIGDNVCFIHGYACWNEKDNLVLGIDENSEIIDPIFTPFRKYFQRASKECNKNFRKWINDIKSRFRADSLYYNPKSEHNLYIIGHSLTLSDRFILNELITLQNMTTTIYYHSEDNRINLMKNLAAILGYQKFSALVENNFINFEKGSFDQKIQEIKLD